MALWYVDSSKTGGSNNGTSRANAWLAFSSIGTNAAPGDIILVYRGTGAVYAKWTVAESGSSATARITVKGVDEGAGKPAIVGIDGGAFDYLAIIGFEIVQASSANNYPGIRLAGSVGWLIQDNYIHNTYGSGIACANSTVNTDNIIRCNTFYGIGYAGAGAGDPVTMYIMGARNLIEYNSLTQSLDRVTCFGGAGNIVRNNYWGVTTANVGWSAHSQTPVPHIDDFQTYGTSGVTPLTQTLYDKNYSVDNGPGTDAHASNMQDDLSLGFEWFIHRFNVTVRMGGGLFDFKNFDRVYEYNDTNIALLNGASSVYGNAAFWDLTGGTSDLADVRNNTFSYCPNVVDSPGGVYASGLRPTNFTSAKNHSYNVSGSQPILPTGASPSNIAGSTAPGFVDGTGAAGHDDYRLGSGSALRSVGTYLTLANGSGSSSTTLIVDDAKRFVDGKVASGWAAIDADYIKIGAGALVQIVSVDYATNTITLASARTWSDNDEVRVKGMDDVGALPYDYAASSLQLSNTTASVIPAGAANLTATSSTPEAVRKVEFFVDGVPVGEVAYNAAGTYSLAWTSDGGDHTVEARAYNYWASATPTVAYSLQVTGTSTLAQGKSPGRSTISFIV